MTKTKMSDFPIKKIEIILEHPIKITDDLSCPGITVNIFSENTGNLQLIQSGMLPILHEPDLYHIEFLPIHLQRTMDFILEKVKEIIS